MSRPLCMTELIAVADFRLQSKSPANSVLKSPAKFYMRYSTPHVPAPSVVAIFIHFCDPA